MEPGLRAGAVYSKGIYIHKLFINCHLIIIWKISVDYNLNEKPPPLYLIENNYNNNIRHLVVIDDATTK